MPASLDLAIKELGFKPDIIVVWASPEIGRLHFFQGLIKEGFITKVLERLDREGLDGPVKATSPGESLSIRMGLEYISNNYGPDTYVIMQCADVLPQPGVYQYLNREMNSGVDGVLMFREGGIVRSDNWNTNFFAVSLNKDYWPPICNKDHHDILERQWGIRLQEQGLTNFVKSHNSRCKKYIHEHTSETKITFPILPQIASASVNLQYTGYKSTRTIIFEFFRRFFNGNN